MIQLCLFRGYILPKLPSASQGGKRICIGVRYSWKSRVWIGRIGVKTRQHSMPLLVRTLLPDICPRTDRGELDEDSPCGKTNEIVANEDLINNKWKPKYTRDVEIMCHDPLNCIANLELLIVARLASSKKHGLFCISGLEARLT